LTHDVRRVIRHLLALAGADPRRARIPRGKHRLDIHTQRIGEVRLITVAPASGPLPELEEPVGDYGPATEGRLLLRGLLVDPAPPASLWLVLVGAGALPLVAAAEEIEQTLRALVGHPVIVRGTCAAAGLVVHSVQAEAATCP
jgi:hypothetical protein